MFLAGLPALTAQSSVSASQVLICRKSISHSTDLARVFSEAHRVLPMGGIIAVSDIMATDGAGLALVSAAFDWLGVRIFATPSDYATMAHAVGLRIEHAEERSKDVQAHYPKPTQAITPSPTGSRWRLKIESPPASVTGVW